MAFPSLNAAITMYVSFAISGGSGAGSTSVCGSSMSEREATPRVPFLHVWMRSRVYARVRSLGLRHAGVGTCGLHLRRSHRLAYAAQAAPFQAGAQRAGTPLVVVSRAQRHA